MTNSPLPLTGIEVFHSGGHSFLCGARSGCELSLFIEGSKGEYIDRIDVFEENSQDNLEKALGGLQHSQAVDAMLTRYSDLDQFWKNC